MFGNHSTNQQGFDSREALRDTNPEMGGAFEVARQRQEITRRGVENIYRAIGLVSPSVEVQQHATAQEMTQGSYSPVAEAEAIARQAAEQQAAMGAGAREQLQTITDNSPVIEDRNPRTPAVPPPTEVQSHVSYITQIADNRYNGNLSGMR